MAGILRASALATIVVVCAGGGCNGATERSAGDPSSSVSRPRPPESTAGAFGGDWYAHGIGISIDADGQGTATWRTYRDCDIDPPPCDTFRGHGVFSGGAARFDLRQVDGTVATGRVLTTTDPAAFPVGSLEAYLDRKHDVLHITPSPRATPFCRSSNTGSRCAYA
jgi:hypothetical protein